MIQLTVEKPPSTLEVQQAEYKRRRFLAMPLAGILAWLAVGIAGIVLPAHQAVWVLFIASGSIVYIGMFISRFTGENFMDRSRPKNVFDGLFMQTLLMALLVYSLAIPFFLVDYTSLPLTVGVLTGLMWVPMSWSLQHWIGVAHGVIRTFSILLCWYLFPEHRFVIIPFVIVGLYVFVIVVLERRWRKENTCT